MARYFINRDYALMLDLGLSEIVDLFFYKFICDRCPRHGIPMVRFLRKDFLAHLKKHCQKFTVSDRTVFRMIERLEKAGLIEVICDGFGGALVKVTFLNSFHCHEKQNQTDMADDQIYSEDIPPKEDSPCATQKGLLQQQQLIETKKICSSVGINYRLAKDWGEIASYGLDKVRDTAEYFRAILARGKTVIQNPEGWFRQALRDNYYLDYNPPDTGLVNRFIEIFSAKKNSQDFDEGVKILNQKNYV